MVVKIGYPGHVDTGVFLHLLGIAAFFTSRPEYFTPVGIEVGSHFIQQFRDSSIQLFLFLIMTFGNTFLSTGMPVHFSLIGFFFQPFLTAHQTVNF